MLPHQDQSQPQRRRSSAASTTGSGGSGEFSATSSSDGGGVSGGGGGVYLFGAAAPVGVNARVSVDSAIDQTSGVSSNYSSAGCSVIGDPHSQQSFGGEFPLPPFAQPHNTVAGNVRYVSTPAELQQRLIQSGRQHYGHSSYGGGFAALAHNNNNNNNNNNNCLKGSHSIEELSRAAANTAALAGAMALVSHHASVAAGPTQMFVDDGASDGSGDGPPTGRVNGGPINMAGASVITPNGAAAFDAAHRHAAAAAAAAAAAHHGAIPAAVFGHHAAGLMAGAGAVPFVNGSAHHHQQQQQQQLRHQQQQFVNNLNPANATTNSLVKALLSGQHHQRSAHAAAALANGAVAAGGGVFGVPPSQSSSRRGSNAGPPSASGAAPSPSKRVEPDRPIGYGAFGVVWSVTDPRDNRRVALKKMPNVFQNLASCKRVFRELRMLASFKHDNVLCLLDILQPSNPHFFQEIHVLTELMQSDLHKIIVSPQPLTKDHIKVFVYQILRGLKYLHSANVLHRDIKPGNLLVNSNCILKVCDFGLARVWEHSDQQNMTHEVVTQYYRAPELLMGARRYTGAVDVWSVGCIFAELLSRRILFQAHGPVEQLNLIIELFGTPTRDDMRTACEGARNHVLREPRREANLSRLYKLTQPNNHEAIPFLQEMLRFDPEKRMSVAEALKHPYLEEGRMRFHSCMCTCCEAPANSRERVFAPDLDPCHDQPFSASWEKELSRLSMFDLRDRLYRYVTERQSLHGIPLCINVNSATYGEFANSCVAQPSELPPSPNAWD